MASPRDYLRLTKPGIIRGNAITLTAGFFLAAGRHGSLGLFAATLIGLSLIVASGCVVNNYLDRGIDAKMSRTKNRALVTGKISVTNALVFGGILGIWGGLILAVFTNPLTLILAVFGWVMYVVAYGYAKRKTPFGTEVGSIAGAIPPVVGYCAVTNDIDLGAGLLFLILVIWQMPHFHAIAIARLSDYKAAGLPVLPAVRGIPATRLRMLLYIVAFLVVAPLLSVFGYTGYVFLGTALIGGFLWLKTCVEGWDAPNIKIWAQKMFRLSLIVITALCAVIALDALLP